MDFNIHQQKLFMVMLGCTPAGRHTEQHDVFFGISDSLKNLIPQLLNFWPEAKDKLHIDAWREINYVNGHKIEVVQPARDQIQQNKLFFINLGGYIPNEFDEQHYKMVVVAISKADAIAQAKKRSFYKNNGFKGATSHIDNKYGVDVDDIFEIKDILNHEAKDSFSLKITASNTTLIDEIHLGYLPLKKIK